MATVFVDPQTNIVWKTAAFSTTTTNNHMLHPPTKQSKQPMGITVEDPIHHNDNNHMNDDTKNPCSSSSPTATGTSQTSSNTGNFHSNVLLYEERMDPTTQRNTITKVRIATPLDDMDVAYLRMSVFSDVHTELIRSQFCTRSCQAIAFRRLRGAICFVATRSTITATTTPTSHFGQIPSYSQSNVLSTQWNTVHDDNDDTSPKEVVVGSIECSYHEFFHTRLGACRKQYALLYITEVAVHTSVRRQGIGTQLLRAVDEYCVRQLQQQQQSLFSNNDDNIDHDRGSTDPIIIESLYLHVDVSNHGAIRMYEQCGYHKVLSNDPIYTEFTTGLNLQPGAIPGREHYLLCKNLVPNPIWLMHRNSLSPNTSRDDDDDDNNNNTHPPPPLPPKQQQQQQRHHHPILSRLGIEIPA
jgi:ribosomal protein S18 acetylase RimI-like enzyme